MTMLTRGIRIQYPERENIAERLSINDGIQSANHVRVPTDSFEYLPDRFIPKKSWRQLTGSDLPTLLYSITENEKTQLADTVSLCRLPEDVIEEFKTIGIEKVKSIEHLQILMNSKRNEFQKLNYFLQEFLQSILLPGGRFEFQGIRVGKNNLITTAHTDKLKLVGMHIDNASGRDPLEFQPDKRRLCINLGLEYRYFLFVNKTIHQIIDMVSKYKDIDSQTYSNSHSLSDDFFKYYPDYPIIRVRQRPYDVYVAPTDSLIHDGSTEGSKSPDIDMTFLGDFNLQHL